MIYELRTYTVKPGTLGDMVKAASTVSRDIRGDNFGKLEGYWFTEIGPLNQVMHMWSYSDLNERARLRAELAKNARWTSEYIPLIRPFLVRQDVRLLNAIKPPVAPASTGNVYELRNYRAKPLGAAANGSMRSPRRCRRARNIPRSSASGRPRPASPTKSATSGPIRASMPAPKPAPPRPTIRCGRNFSARAPHSWTRCTPPSCSPRRIRR